MERPRNANFVFLAIFHCILVQAHTFGIVYVICIGLSGCLSTWRHEDSKAGSFLLSMVPAIVVFACWLPFLMMQLEVANPYGWIPRPGILELVKSTFLSPLSALIGLSETALIIGLLPSYLRRRAEPSRMGLLWLAFDRAAQSYRFACMLLLSISLFAISAWAISRGIYPFFVARYFTPNLIISFALNVALCQLLIEFFKTELLRTLPRGIVRATAIVPPTLVAALFLYRMPVHPEIPCLDETGAFFEDHLVRQSVPVVVESPHVWFPRSYYSHLPSLYHFPLDRDVVLNFPGQATNNAADFNIMQRFKVFAHVSTILSTEEIIRSYPQFYVVNETGRAWFHNLVNIKQVTADKLAETPLNAEGGRCILWHVKSVQDLRS
jgi:hypothetical protein